MTSPRTPHPVPEPGGLPYLGALLVCTLASGLVAILLGIGIGLLVASRSC